METADEKTLLNFSKELGLLLPDTVKAVDKCIQQTAAYHNVSYAKVYAIVFQKEIQAIKGMQTNVAISALDTAMPAKPKSTVESVPITINTATNVKCTTLNETECLAENTCIFIDPYGCLSRYIPDADKINENPEKYIEKYLGNTEELKKVTRIAAYLYYNFAESGLSDNAFDALEYHLKKREKQKMRLYEKIGAPVIEKLKVRLSYGLPSLGKVKPGSIELTKFLDNFVGGTQYNKAPQCAWSQKLDGISGMAIYKNGVLSSLNTKGNDGIHGGNVLFLMDYMSTIPRKISKTTGIFVVRGEFIVSKDNWEKKYKGTYSNARAFVSGKINTGYVTSALNDIEFVAYQIMDDTSKSNLVGVGLTPSPSQAYKILEAEGFRVVDNGLLSAPTVFELMELYKKKRLESDYFIDGLVLTVDKTTLSVSRLNVDVTYLDSPTNSVAFKMLLEEQERWTKIIDIDWSISRYGRYVPVAVYETVYVDGVRMTRATAHNAAYVRDMNLGKGTRVKIVRSGDVIPQIKDVNVDDKIIPLFPLEYGETKDGMQGYEWHWQNRDIVLDDIDGNDQVQIKRMAHFFETLEIPKLGPKTLEKFYHAGFKKPEDVVKAKVSDMIKIKGIGKKGAEGFYNNIKDVLSKTPPDRFIAASTTFQSGLGRKLLKQLFIKVPTILTMNANEIETLFKKNKMPGFGPQRIKSVTEGIPKFKEYLDSFAKEDVEKAINYYVKRMKELDENGRNPMIKDKDFVLSSFMDKKLKRKVEDYIYDQQGDIVSNVSSKVSAVIVGNVMDITKKMTVAASLGVTILSFAEFVQRYNVQGIVAPKQENEDDTD